MLYMKEAELIWIERGTEYESDVGASEYSLSKLR